MRRRPSRRALWVAAPLTWLCVATPAASCACALQLVPVQPAAPEPTDTYVGRTATLELRFHNDKAGLPVDAFPEPPLTVRQLKTGDECAIQDGGAWVRQHVYTGADGRTLVTHEYSGSNDELVFHDTHSCRRKAAIDVSNARWAIEGASVVVPPAKPGEPGKRPVRTAFDAACLPEAPPACGGSIGAAQSKGDKSVGEVWNQSDCDNMAYYANATAACTR